MKHQITWRAACGAAILSAFFLPAQAQYFPYVPTPPDYSATIFIDLSNAASNALTQPNGRLEMPMGQGYGQEVATGLYQLQWTQVPQRTPVALVDRVSFSTQPIGFTMAAANGDKLTFDKLSFNLATGSVNGDIYTNNQLVLSGNIWSGTGSPIPLYPATAGTPLLFSTAAQSAVASFVANIGPDSIRAQYKAALLDNPIGSIHGARSVIQAIPEPSSVVLMALGLGGVFAARRPRRR